MNKTFRRIALASALAVGVLVWAIRPIADDLGRSCGGGVFSSTSALGSDDSYKDVCDGLRDARVQIVQPVALVAGLALVACLGWVSLMGCERRQQLV